MTPEQNQVAWLAYETAMEQWERMGSPRHLKPRLPLQLGRHIDSLPVEMNKANISNMPVPIRRAS